MRIFVSDDVEAAAQRGAALIADKARAAIASRGRACLALSGGRTPWAMMRALASEKLSWGDVHIFQTDERAASSSNPERTLTHLREALLSLVPLRSEHVHLSFPKIISGRIGDAIRPELALQRLRRSAGSIAAMAHPSGVIDADAFDCNMRHKQ